MVTHKGEPRYIVATVTGYTITGATETNARREMTSYYVLDRAYGYHRVASYPATVPHSQPVSAMCARATCEALNDGKTPPVWDARRHELVYT